jgi:MarR family 2-MHQ and catechol resistance regulon transcriptional repressor
MPTSHRGTEAEQLALDVYIKLLRAADTISAQVREHVAQFGLTETQFAVLEALYHLGDLRASDLARKLLRSGANITTVVDNLVRTGLAHRSDCPGDRRVTYVGLTEQGQRLIEQVFPSVARYLCGRMACLDSTEQRDLARLSRKLGLGNCHKPICSTEV